VRNGKQAVIPVILEETFPPGVEIRSGLKADDQVVIGRSNATPIPASSTPVSGRVGRVSSDWCGRKPL